MNTADVLEKAADFIDERGWWNSLVDTPDGQEAGFCAYLAMSRIGGADGAERAARALGVHVGLNFTWSPIAVYHWNDAQPDAAHVTGPMRDCAASLRDSRTGAQADTRAG